MKRAAVAAIMFFTLLAADSRADIYRWEDEAGTVHFTDELSNVPPAFRGKAKLVIREGPKPVESPPPAPPVQVPGQAQPAPPSAPPREDPEEAAARDREEAASQVEQVKAKIAAKESFIQYVEDRQNLILNPDRRRVLNPGDQALARKYQEELPRDRQTLQDLENRLESLK